jgi:hypothetical protein
MANGQYDGSKDREVQAGSGYGSGGINQISGPRPRPDTSEDNWAHRATGMRCHTCMFFVVKMTEPGPLPPSGALGRCRRHAPTLGGYPAVYEMDWCGDHKVR